MKQIFKELDNWIIQEKSSETHSIINECYFKILGQTALFEAKCDLTLIETADVDAYTNANFTILKKLDELLKESGKHYDYHSNEIWMPGDTTYIDFYNGYYVTAKIAKEEYVLISKAKKAPEKNYNLILEYIAKKPSKLFFDLVEKYDVNLDSLISDYG